MKCLFFDLPPSVLSSVFGLLHDEDYSAFIALRFTCRKHRSISERYLLRSVVFRGVRDAESVLLKRMRSAQGISENVHCIRIVPSGSRSRIALNLAALLEPCWTDLIQLKDIIWESSLPIPRYLLDLISTRSTLRLHYVNTSRVSSDQSVMDKALLSHPNLHTLKYTALALGEPPRSWPSELGPLKSCLIKGRNLKVLHLNIYADQNYSISDFEHGELNFPFAQGDNFPALQKLVLDPWRHHYQPNPEHCTAWTKSMSWSQLNTLDFGNGSPTYLMSALTGRVPQLKQLTFGFSYDPEGGPMWRCNDLNIAEAFILAIDALQSVRMLSHTDDQMRKIRSSLLKKHGKSLKNVSADLGVRDIWQLEDFVQVAEKVPNLQSLTTTLGVMSDGTGRETMWPGHRAPSSPPIRSPAPISVHSPIREAPPTSKPRTSRFEKLKTMLRTPSSHLTKTEKPLAVARESSFSSAATTMVCPRSVHEVLTSMHTLYYLDLSIRLFKNTYDLVVDTRYPVITTSSLLDPAKATNLILKLWYDFGNGSMIELIKVSFHAPSPSGKIFTYTARKRWRDGKYEVDVSVEEEGHDVEVYDPFG